jgi:hypothetical protein
MKVFDIFRELKPPETPFERSYWVVPGKLLAGFYPSSDIPVIATERIKKLISSEVGYIINLTEKDEINRFDKPLVDYVPELIRIGLDMKKEIICKRIPVRDLDIPSPELMKQILDEIDAAVFDGKTVYVHCLGGIGRTGTVVGCYLVRHGIVTGGKVLAKIKKLRRNDPSSFIQSPETIAQREFVKNWKAGY